MDMKARCLKMTKTGMDLEDLGISVDVLIDAMKKASGVIYDQDLAAYMRRAAAWVGVDRSYPSSAITHWKKRKRIPLGDLWIFCKYQQHEGKPTSLDTLIRSAEEVEEGNNNGGQK